jgi:hypothetical protein
MDVKTKEVPQIPATRAFAGRKSTTHKLLPQASFARKMRFWLHVPTLLEDVMAR